MNSLKNKKIMSNKKYMLLSLMSVFVAAVLAILVHALFPGGDAGAVEEEFDSILVRLLGFPLVASLYFVILYLQIFLSIKHFQKESPLPKIQNGLRCGIAFAIIYIFGMQEVILSASPYKTYGIKFIIYELFMGLGDALPALGLCLVVSLLAPSFVKNDVVIQVKKENSKRSVVIILAITIGFFLQRMIGYLTGYIESDFQSCPIPTVIWTLLFGLVFGIAYILLEPIYSKNKRGVYIILFTLGVNWVWFNMFIGLIYKGMLFKMSMRGLMDIFTVYLFFHIALMLYSKFTKFNK